MNVTPANGFRRFPMTSSIPISTSLRRSSEPSPSWNCLHLPAAPSLGEGFIAFLRQRRHFQQLVGNPAEGRNDDHNPLVVEGNDILDILQRRCAAHGTSAKFEYVHIRSQSVPVRPRTTSISQIWGIILINTTTPSSPAQPSVLTLIQRHRVFINSLIEQMLA